MAYRGVTANRGGAESCGTSFEAVIEREVDRYFEEHANQMADSLRARIEDTQLRILDGFFKSLETGTVARIQRLEEQSSEASEALQDIRSRSAKSNDDLRRLANGIRGLIGD